MQCGSAIASCAPRKLRQPAACKSASQGALRTLRSGCLLRCAFGLQTKAPSSTLFTEDWDFTPPHNCTTNGTRPRASVQEIVPQLQTKAMAFKAMRGGCSPPRTLKLQHLPGFDGAQGRLGVRRHTNPYTRPWSSMALATFRKPPMLAPFTRLPGVPYFSAVS